MLDRYQKETVAEQLPWIIFKLKEQLFTINTKTVISIYQLPNEITPIPESEDFLEGVMNLRGEIIPIISLRKLFSMGTIEDESRELLAMLEQRKQDHVNWVNELVNSVRENRRFSLATDPHMCAFGKWYDNYNTNNATLAMHLKKIREPHDKLHETAIIVDRCVNSGDYDGAQYQISLARDQYMPEVLKYIDESARALSEGYRQMVIALNNGEKTIGVITDEIISVESIEIIENNITNFYKKDCVTGFAKSANIEGNIMMLDEGRFFDVASLEQMDIAGVAGGITL